MPIFSCPEFADHEQVTFAADAATGLRVIIALHDTRRGPAIGGCRMWLYGSEEAALTDVLRLSKGMTYKAVMAGLPLRGGKAVIIGDPRTDKSPALMQAMGTTVDRLGGRFIIAEDVGTTVGDTVEFRRTTPHVVGLPVHLGGSGDPSPTTAYGCLVGIKACAGYLWGRGDLDGVRVALRGLGNVGWNLASLLAEAGARLTVCDADPTRARRAAERFDAEMVDPEAIYDADVDIFAPCALGAVVNEGTVARLKAKVIAGAANNQLAHPADADRLSARGILYAPDYVINAGGLIRVASERDGFHQDGVDRRVAAIGGTLLKIFEGAKKAQVSTEAASRTIAQQRLKA